MQLKGEEYKMRQELVYVQAVRAVARIVSIENVLGLRNGKYVRSLRSGPNPCPATLKRIRVVTYN